MTFGNFELPLVAPERNLMKGVEHIRPEEEYVLVLGHVDGELERVLDNVEGSRENDALSLMDSGVDAGA